MRRLIPFILYLLLIAFHQTILRDATAIFVATINVTGLLVLLVAMHKPELESGWFGLTAGVVMMAPQPDLLGWQGLALTILALIAFHVRERLNLDALNSRLLLVFGGVLVHNVFTIAITGGTSVYLLTIGSLAGALYTTLPAWVFFLLKDGRITVRKVREIF